jgi:hypothetical protein
MLQLSCSREASVARVASPLLEDLAQQPLHALARGL